MQRADERAAFAAAAGWFRATVDAVGDRWDEPGLGEWTVRDLVGHASRALSTVATYLEAGSPDTEVTELSARDYLVLGSRASSADVAERGRRAGRELGADPAARLQELDLRVQTAVTAASDDAYVGTPFGGMRLVDYLPTRTFELVVHTADLGAALGVETRPPTEAARAALDLATALVLERDDAVDVLLALTGRRPLPSGYTVL